MSRDAQNVCAITKGGTVLNWDPLYFFILGCPLLVSTTSSTVGGTADDRSTDSRGNAGVIVLAVFVGILLVIGVVGLYLCLR